MRDKELINEIETIFHSAAIVLPFLEKQQNAGKIVARQIGRAYKAYLQRKMKTIYDAELSESLDMVQSVMDSIETKDK